MLNASLKSLINKHDIISFDIYDTLLLRKVINPTDLFNEIPKRLNIKDYINFRYIRTQAETQARKNIKM